MKDDLVRRQAAITAIQKAYADTEGGADRCAVWKNVGLTNALHIMQDLPSGQTEKMQLSKEDATKGTTFDCISRQSAIDAVNGLPDCPNGFSETYDKATIIGILEDVPSAQPEIIHCCDCIYYDPEHIEKNGVRYEYRDMPKDAFDSLGTGMVHSEYGINVGGRCCRDYNMGYFEDKRVFVSEQNYCGRAERRQV